MLPLYLASMGFGSALIAVSLFFGGGDKDFDKDLDLDHDGDLDLEGDLDGDGDLDLEGDLDGDAELDAEAAPVDFVGAVQGEIQGVDKDTSALADILWIPIFSMRFWTFGTAAFGFTGTALTLGSLPWLVVLLLALVFGTGSGTAAAAFFRALKKDNVSGATTLRSYAGEEARVVLPIAPDGRGKIVLDTSTGHVELLATTRDRTAIPRGSTVLIAGVRDGVADVSALDAQTDEVRRIKAASRKDPA